MKTAELWEIWLDCTLDSHTLYFIKWNSWECTLWSQVVYNKKQSHTTAQQMFLSAIILWLLLNVNQWQSFLKLIFQKSKVNNSKLIVLTFCTFSKNNFLKINVTTLQCTLVTWFCWREKSFSLQCRVNLFWQGFTVWTSRTAKITERRTICSILF